MVESSANACQNTDRMSFEISKKIDNETPVEMALHLIADNYGAHKTERVKSWLSRHPRFHMHFTPTSASWLNMVERFFSEITTKQIRRGVFRSTKELEKTIMDFLRKHNENFPKYLHGQRMRILSWQRLKSVRTGTDRTL